MNPKPPANCTPHPKPHTSTALTWLIAFRRLIDLWLAIRRQVVEHLIGLKFLRSYTKNSRVFPHSPRSPIFSGIWNLGSGVLQTLKMNTKSKPCKYASYVRTTKGKGKCKDTQLKAPFMKTGTLGLVFQKGVGWGALWGWGVRQLWQRIMNY